MDSFSVSGVDKYAPMLQLIDYDKIVISVNVKAKKNRKTSYCEFRTNPKILRVCVGVAKTRCAFFRRHKLTLANDTRQTLADENEYNRKTKTLNNRISSTTNENDRINEHVLREILRSKLFVFHLIFMGMRLVRLYSSAQWNRLEFKLNCNFYFSSSFVANVKNDCIVAEWGAFSATKTMSK